MSGVSLTPLFSPAVRPMWPPHGCVLAPSGSGVRAPAASLPALGTTCLPHLYTVRVGWLPAGVPGPQPRPEAVVWAGALSQPCRGLHHAEGRAAPSPEDRARSHAVPLGQVLAVACTCPLLCLGVGVGPQAPRAGRRAAGAVPGRCGLRSGHTHRSGQDRGLPSLSAQQTLA